MVRKLDLSCGFQQINLCHKVIALHLFQMSFIVRRKDGVFFFILFFIHFVLHKHYIRSNFFKFLFFMFNVIHFKFFTIFFFPSFFFCMRLLLLTYLFVWHFLNYRCFKYLFITPTFMHSRVCLVIERNKISAFRRN